MPVFGRLGLTMDLSAFKAYDIRGRIPDQLNVELAEQIGLAYAAWLKPSNVIVGHDIRLTSPELTEALISGLRKAGVNCHFIGECGTEEVYFATDFYEMDGGIMVTASHNPKDYNGMKFVRENSKPVSGDDGLAEIEALIREGVLGAYESEETGALGSLDHRKDYIAHLLNYVDRSALKPLKIVTDAGHGGAGIAIDELAPHLPFEFVSIHHAPDGHFPEGVPNPLLVENRASTIEAIKESKADFGIAWDGDFDRCFFFDQNGRFMEGYYMVGLLASSFLDREPGAAIAYDPRLTWNTIDIAKTFGGEPLQSKTGHAFIKEKMRLEDAIYSGEMSAHHYFRDFFYCDSGMIPWLLIIELVSKSGLSLSKLVNDMIIKYPSPGEMNFKVKDPRECIKKVLKHFELSALSIDSMDGVSMEFQSRFKRTPMECRRNVDRRSKGLRWNVYGLSIEFQKNFDGISMEFR